MKKIEEREVLHRLADRIRQFRLEGSISQEDLASRCNLDRSYISRIERGVANPSVISLVRIAAALNRELVELFK